MNDDVQHLRLLVIGHYIGAAITALFACFPLIHFTIGLFFLLHPPQLPEGEQFPSEMVGLIFALMGGAFVLVGWTLAACIFAAGRSIAARKRHTFCIVVAGINCAFFPLGTLLGVFTILVLLRPSVKAMFSQQTAPETLPANAPQPGAWRDKSFIGPNDG
jgi:hypothetical protein